MRRDTVGCGFFFFLMGSFYAQLMSRMPAMKELLAVDDAGIGVALAFFGGGSLAGLFLCPFVLARVPSKPVLSLSAFLLLLLLPVAGCSQSLLPYCLLLGTVGILCGFFDVCMNTQGVLHERALGRSRMGLLQACFSAGGLLGALFSFLCARWMFAPSMHFLLFSAAGLAGWLFAAPCLRGELREQGVAAAKGHIPLFVFFCGIMELCVFVSSGCVDDWGSVLLRSCKGADEGVAALAVGAASLPMFFVRLFCDSLRAKVGDFPLLFGGSLIAASGLSIAICCGEPVLVLCGFSLVGLGLGPGVPVLMSHAGKVEGVAPSAACAVVSSIGCSGLLFFPPVLGFLSRTFGLERAMLVPLAFCLLIVLGSFCFLQKARTPKN